MSYDKILFGTSNIHKLKEAQKVFENTGIKIEHYPVALEKLQINDPNIFVEDTGLFIESLSGFPGPFASHAFKTLGNMGILKLMDGIKKRDAYFESCVAFRDFDNNIVSFTARCNGNISNTTNGEKWGFDPIFIPKNKDNPKNLTFSQLGDEFKSKISHRALALEKLKSYIENKNTT